MHALRLLLHTLGPLRLVLTALVLASVVSAGFAGGEIVYTFPDVISTLVAPPFAIMMFFVIPLDLLMTWIFMRDAPVGEQARLRLVIYIELGLLGLLIAVWTPFFSTLATR